MTNKIICCVIFILNFLSCEDKNEVSTINKLKTNKIDSLANRYRELNRFSGKVLVAENQLIIYDKSFGFADYENQIPFSDKTAFKIGDISKIITEDIILKLAKKKSIKLTDKVSKYISAFESESTINDLIIDSTHSSKNTLGKLIEKVSSKSYQENIEEYVKDLKLENTYYQKENLPTAKGYLYNNYRGKGLELNESPTYDVKEAFSSKGIKSTAHDLFKILVSNPRNENIIGYIENDGFSYALVNNTKSNRLILILSNKRHPVAEEMSKSIKAILEDKAYRLPLPRELFNIDKTTLKNFSGKYSINKSVNFKVVKSNDSLFVLMGPNKVYLIPQSDNQFYMEQMDASMRFLKDSTSIINRVVLLNGFMDSDEQAIKFDK